MSKLIPALAVLSVWFTWNQIPALSSAPGAGNSLSMERADGAVELLSFACGVGIKVNDRFVINAASGGNWLGE